MFDCNGAVSLRQASNEDGGRQGQFVHPYRDRVQDYDDGRRCLARRNNHGGGTLHGGIPTINQGIIHNCRDDKSETILSNIVAVKDPKYSRLMIHDHVLPDTGAEGRAAAMGAHTMLVLSGKERSQRQGENLSSGFALDIVKILYPGTGYQSVIKLKYGIDARIEILSIAIRRNNSSCVGRRRRSIKPRVTAAPPRFLQLDHNLARSAVDMAHTAESANLKVSNLFDFSDHVVLISGGATGLGEMTAQAFVQNGARVIIASRKQSELEKTSSRLNKLGPGKCEFIVADLKDKAGCQKLCEEVKKRTDRITVLVNNSGATWGAPYFDFPESGWDKIMSLNVKSIFYTTVGLHELLTKDATADSPSRVINVASIAGISTADVTSGEEGGLAAPGSGTFSYGPSKAACIHLSKTLASKLMPDHVTVNAVCPGVFPSRMTAYGAETAMETLLSRQPGGRVGKPEDFAGLMLFIASRGAAHLTGNAFEIDGGSNLSGYRGRGRTTVSKM